MDGYTLTEKMRKARRRFRFTAVEQALFYELVAICNGEDWGDAFDCSNIELCMALNIQEKTLIKARENLINAKMFYYRSGKSKRSVGSYSFVTPFATTVNNTVVNTVNPTVNPTANRTVNPTANRTDLFKGKTKTKTKTKPPSPPLQGNEGVEDEKSWRNDFDIYKSELREAFKKVSNNQEFIDKQERYHPGLNICLSIEKACVNYWSKEVGWKKKRNSPTNTIDWNATFINALDVKSNQVWLKKDETNGKEDETKLPAFY
ncbi:MAG: hypothetical protein LBG15_00550 [Dysgonamonadaceae bacterium]|jgi:hypothetical protein|nr:hypothetical protein [Dysgonamonadaceae bacterium]